MVKRMLVVLGTLVALMGCNDSTRPMGGWMLACTVAQPGEHSVVVNWRFDNLSGEDVWFPSKFDVTQRERPYTSLPFQFLVPGGRVMSVAAVFSRMPGFLGAEEGTPLTELVRVAPGRSIAGKITILLPFTLDELSNPLRPNPFTQWGAGSRDGDMDQEEQIQVITSFQMAAEVYHLSDAILEYFKSRYSCGDGRIIVDDYPSLDIAKSTVTSGKFWASALTRVQNRHIRMHDFAEWSVSPIYEVNWPVGSHPRVGLLNPRVNREIWGHHTDFPCQPGAGGYD